MVVENDVVGEWTLLIVIESGDSTDSPVVVGLVVVAGNWWWCILRHPFH